jgi:DNA primase
MNEEDWGYAALTAVVSEYGLGTVSYGERAMKCPVHDDTHASASCNGGKGVWHCHGCGASGNAVHIVMARENLEYGKAKEFVENLVGGKPNPNQYKGRARKSGTRWIPPRLRNN